MLLDAAQDLGAVDLPQHDLGVAHRGLDVRHAPAVAVEHRQRVQVGVAVGDAGVQAEGRRVEPQVPVGELDALGARGRARRVVDGGGGVLVRIGPRPRLGAVLEQVLVLAEQELVRDVELVEDVLQRRIGVDDVGAAVPDDVLDLRHREPEVHRDEDPAPRRDAEERRQQAGAVLADDGDAAADGHAEVVEERRLGARLGRQLAIRPRTQGSGGLVRLVDEGGAIGVDVLGAMKEVADGQRYLHEAQPTTVVGPASRYGARSVRPKVVRNRPVAASTGLPSRAVGACP